MSRAKLMIPLTHRGVLRLSGIDRAVFLQGLISNDINLCTPHRAVFAALLTPQGKFLHDLFIHHADDHFLIDCEAERAGDLLQRLKAYKLRAKIILEDVSADYEVGASLEGGEGLPDPRLPALGSRAIVRKGELALPHNNVDAAAYDRQRLMLGVTDGSRDMIVGKSSLSDGNFDFLNGISWTKGCYIGQELTARMHHRALVKKRMFPVTIAGRAPEPGALLSFDGVEIGEMRSSAGEAGIAILNIEMAKQVITAKTIITSGVVTLMPHQPDWLKI